MPHQISQPLFVVQTQMPIHPLQQLRQVGEPTLTWCRIVSVRSDEETRELLAALTACFSVRVLQARPSVSCAGVRNGYRDFARLGLDRW